MKVVLIDEVSSLGISGDVRDVKDGYARNFLIPKRLAVKATKQELARADSRRSAEIERRTRLNMEMEGVGERLAEERLFVAVRVGPGGRLYGSVTSTEIADAVNEAMGVSIERRAVNLPQPIRETGHHQVSVRLAPDVIPTATVTVYAEGTDPPALDDVTADAETGAETEDAFPDAAMTEPDAEPDSESDSAETDETNDAGEPPA